MASSPGLTVTTGQGSEAFRQRHRRRQDAQEPRSQQPSLDASTKDDRRHRARPRWLKGPGQALPPGRRSPILNLDHGWRLGRCGCPRGLDCLVRDCPGPADGVDDTVHEFDGDTGLGYVHSGFVKRALARTQSSLWRHRSRAPGRAQRWHGDRAGSVWAIRPGEARAPAVPGLG